MNLTLSLTHACNLACTYCYAGPKHQALMSEEVARRAIRLALDRARGTLILGFFGGEPLLAWDLLRRTWTLAAEAARERDVALRTVLTTNGTRADKRRAAWLAEHGVCVAVSLDGHRAMHDTHRRAAGGGSSFQAALTGLRALRSRIPAVQVLTVVTPATVGLLVEGCRWLVDEEGVGDVSVNPDYSAPWGDESAAGLADAYDGLGDLLIERYRAGRPVRLRPLDSKIVLHLKGGYADCDRCGFGQSELAVAPSGRLYPCERLIGADVCADGRYVLGDVFTGPSAERVEALRPRTRAPAPECEACPILSRCMHFCGCINAVTTGRPDLPGGMVCAHERAAVRAADRVARTLFSEANPWFMQRFYRERAPSGNTVRPTGEQALD